MAGLYPNACMRMRRGKLAGHKIVCLVNKSKRSPENAIVCVRESASPSVGRTAVAGRSRQATTTHKRAGVICHVSSLKMSTPSRDR